MDYETLKNCFAACFHSVSTDERREYVVHKLRDDFEELVIFLRENVELDEWHVSFNGLAFDAQITMFILENAEGLAGGDPEFIAHEIYLFAQETIQTQEQGEWPRYKEKQIPIRQVDLFKLNHWDNPAKRSSLKWIQYSMDWHNLQEMPIHHSTFIQEQGQIAEILSYCHNDTGSTKQVMIRSKDQINLRAALTSQYNIPLYSASEPRISKELFLHFLSEKTGVSKWDLRQGRTAREEIRVGELILPYVKFQRPEFRGVLEHFNEMVLAGNNTKGLKKFVVKHKGVETVYGLGGLHGAAEPGVYKTGNGMLLMSSDVVSFYPRLAMKNRWAPAHLSLDDFCEQYEWFFTERRKIPKKDIRNYVYKIILNATFGLSIEENSFLYDPQFGMQITINGQLLLSMLYEMLSDGIPGSKPLMQNTDGLEMLIPAQSRARYMEICTQWERMTSLELEHEEYQKLMLWDVNNYIGLYKYKEVKPEDFEKLKEKNPQDLFKEESGRYYHAATKAKGRFEFKDLALHKNKSYLIIAKAIFHYFIHDIPPERFLSENRNIFDYCAGSRIKGDWKFQQTCIVDGKVVTEDLQKTIRYFISHRGCKIIKQDKTSNRQIQLESGKILQTVFNTYLDKPWPEYDVDDNYYLTKIYREIASVNPPDSDQLKLFP
jgi:hypothetical protein